MAELGLTPAGTLILGPFLALQRCPHCSVDRPNLGQTWEAKTTDATGGNSRAWKAYACSRCGGIVLAVTGANHVHVTATYPSATKVQEAIPQSVRRFLDQALNSLHSPDGCVMLCASAIDSMLKERGLKAGNLYPRIEEAAKTHLITDDMAKWAHEVRLDANEPRHADQAAPPPDAEDARKCVDFALALAEFLFVLPARVTRGRAAAAAQTRIA